MQAHNRQDQEFSFPFLSQGSDVDRYELLKRERRLFGLVTASSDAIYRMSADWSQMHQLKLSLEGKQFIAETEETNSNWLNDYIFPADQAKVLAAIEQSIRTRSMFELEHRVLKVDGSIGWTLSRALPLMTEEGAIIEWFGMATDVTERRLAENREREKDEQLRQVMEVTADGIFVLDREWNFTYVNPKAQALLAANGELVGQNCWELFPENGVAGSLLSEHCHRAMDEGISSDFTGYYPAPFDSWLQAIVRATESGITVFFRDVTASRKSTEALIESERLATIGRLAAAIAHEVNNPLEAVTNLIYLARTSEVSDAASKYLATADLELSRAAAITNQTLRFSKASTKPAEITGIDLIEGVLTLHKGRTASFGVEIDTRFKAARVVFCFEGEIRQVLSNLVGNATDAMQKQILARRLLIRTRDGHDWRTGRPGMVFTIGDTGPGMSAQTLSKAFDAFYSTKGAGGTGLGLWVSKEIAMRHHGELRLRSSQVDGRSGTVFTLFLPYEAVHRNSA